MTSFDIESLPFHRQAVTQWAATNDRHINWPVVYTLFGDKKIYVGETVNAENRLRQHLESAEKRDLKSVRVIVDESFNKSVCLDLESHLIRLFSGDGQFEVMNRNVGITEANYYARSEYRERFIEIFEALRNNGLFTRTIPEIQNSDLFKLSPFKALTNDQAAAVDEILESLFLDIETGTSSTSVVQGNPGTGKTIVGIYLMKLLSDLGSHDFAEPIDEDSAFADLYTPERVAIARQLRIGLVVPQQSLRESIAGVFRKTPGLSASQVLSPYQVGEGSDYFDVLIVDEAHRLSQRANQASAALNAKWPQINAALFGSDDFSRTQLDWVVAKSSHQLLLLDIEQTVRPADLPREITSTVVDDAKRRGRWHPLATQMRVQSSEDYVSYVRAILAGDQVEPITFRDYDLRTFDDFTLLYRELETREHEVGLCRVVAGYAWKWLSKENPEAFDIDIDGVRLRWNTETKDWVNSPNAFREAGSIHTVQGYDLNYAGVIIGPDLRFNPDSARIEVDRGHYFDSKGKENNPRLGRDYSDADLLEYITNIYGVLLTRGICGTYIYVSDKPLREYLSKYFSR